MFEMVVSLMYEMGGVRLCEMRATVSYEIGIVFVFVFEMGVVQLYGMGVLLMFEMVVGLMYEMGGGRLCEMRATVSYEMGIVFVFVFEMGVVQLYGMGVLLLFEMGGVLY